MLYLSLLMHRGGGGGGGRRVLQVRRGEEWQPAVYYSRQLRGAEQRYSATELEALVLVETIAHFGYYLYGRPFTAFTDHKPLAHLMTSPRLNPRLARFSFELQHWLVTVVYLPGELNTLADALSRGERQQEREGRNRHQRMPGAPDIHLAAGDVEATPPHEDRQEPEVT